MWSFMKIDMFKLFKRFNNFEYEREIFVEKYMVYCKIDICMADRGRRENLILVLA